MSAFKWIQIVEGGNIYSDMVTIGQGWSRTHLCGLPSKSEAHSFKIFVQKIYILKILA